MARLLEHQGKELLAKARIAVPKGKVAHSAEDAAKVAEELACPVVLKAQALVTSRAG